MARRSHGRTFSVSRRTYNALTAIARTNGTTLENAVALVCGLPQVPQGRISTAIDVPEAMFMALGKTHRARRNRLDRAVRRALDAAGAA